VMTVPEECLVSMGVCQASVVLVIESRSHKLTVFLVMG
jgi:hypothetical protein